MKLARSVLQKMITMFRVENCWPMSSKNELQQDQADAFISVKISTTVKRQEAKPIHYQKIP